MNTTFYDYWRSLSSEQREALAVSCDTSVGHLRNIAYGKRANEKLAIAIERESGGAVPADEIRPDCKALFDYLRNSGDKQAA